MKPETDQEQFMDFTTKTFQMNPLIHEHDGNKTQKNTLNWTQRSTPTQIFGQKTTKNRLEQRLRRWKCQRNSPVDDNDDYNDDDDDVCNYIEALSEGKRSDKSLSKVSKSSSFPPKVALSGVCLEPILYICHKTLKTSPPNQRNSTFSVFFFNKCIFFYKDIQQWAMQ